MDYFCLDIADNVPTNRWAHMLGFLKNRFLEAEFSSQIIWPFLRKSISPVLIAFKMASSKSNPSNSSTQYIATIELTPPSAWNWPRVPQAIQHRFSGDLRLGTAMATCLHQENWPVKSPLLWTFSPVVTLLCLPRAGLTEESQRAGWQNHQELISLKHWMPGPQVIHLDKRVQARQILPRET